MSLRIHILLGSLFFLGIIVALALFTQSQELELGTLATDVYDNALVGVTNVQKAQTDFVRLAVETRSGKAISKENLSDLLEQLDVAKERAITPQGKQLAGEIHSEIEQLLKPMSETARDQWLTRIDDDLGDLVAKYTADSFIYRVRTDRVIKQIDKGFYVAVWSAALLALIASFSLGQFIVPPISRAVQIATSIAGGKFNNAIAAKPGRSETARLMTALSVMQESIAESTRRAEALRTSEAARLAAEYEREAANRANSAKSEFLATMSHELRTPLNAILGFSEVIREQMMGPHSDRYVGYANDIHTSGQHLLALINDVLDLSKLEAGRLELHEEEIDLPELCNSCLVVVSGQAESGSVRLAQQGTEAVPGLFADARLIRQILLNLLSNAIKFTPSGGVVSLDVRSDARGIHLAVTDTGIGMTEHELAIALSPFGQIDSKIARRHKGTGLGLPIARSLAQLHGGDLTLESASGIGTTVTVQLPSERAIWSRQQPACASGA